jgi:hypothetical protein
VRQSFAEASSSGTPVIQEDTPSTRSPWGTVGALAVAACLGWLPFMARGLSPDEGGLLLVGGQWAPGSSLYGDYWVDRPPVLIGMFAAADGLGGPWALRTLGVVAVVATVLLAGVIGRLHGPGPTWSVVLPAATAAVFVGTPLFGGSVVSAELLALPFVLAGIAAVLASLTADDRDSALWWAMAAGAAGAAAFMVKQNVVDVFVVVLALVASGLRPTPDSGRRQSARLRLLGGAACGGLAMTALVLLIAQGRGTSVAELWDAVVVFRGEATGVIMQSGTASTGGRLAGMLVALAFSGAPVIAGVLAWVARRGLRSPSADRAASHDLRGAAWALLAWETFVVLVGGSYWLHYLMGLVPGLVLLAAATASTSAATGPRRSGRTIATAYGYAACSTLVVIGWVHAHPIDRPEAPVTSYLNEHARPGDTAVVAFGAANALRTTGLESPYAHLWSLPVRVRDPELHGLADVLAGPDAPTWLVVSGRSLNSWGVDGAAAKPYLRARYDKAATAGRFTVYHRNDVP